MQMTSKERLMAAIKREDVDQIPFGMWYHLPHADQDPVLLAETQVRLAQNLELDFIKLMPFGNFQAADFGLSCDYFCTPNDMVFERKFAIEDVREWGDLKELPGSFGNHGKTLMIAQQVKKHLKKKEMDLPFVQTIFSPLTIAKKLAGPRVFTDLREHPEYVHHALDVIAKTCINFVKENLDVGVAGFFFATQCSTYDFLTEEEYITFGRAYDLKVIDAFKDQTWFNIMHIHGDNTMYKLMADYPLQCVNWHDRWAKPNLAEARKLTDRCLMGGINEKWLKDATIPQVHQHLKEAVDMAGRNGLILTPGCVAATNTPMKNYIACRDAVKEL